MAKKVLTQIKLQAVGGQASPAPPVGPALGQHGVNIMEFVKAFNAQTQGDLGTVIPVVITVYEDRSFTFITKSPPAAVLIKQALSLEKGSPEPYREKVGTITQDQLRQIAARLERHAQHRDARLRSRLRTGKIDTRNERVFSFREQMRDPRRDSVLTPRDPHRRPIDRLKRMSKLMGRAVDHRQRSGPIKGSATPRSRLADRG